MAAWIPAAITAGASLIGSLFGGGGSSSSSTSINLQKLVRQAEAAGFNPLTVLRSGAASGFMTTHTPALASAQTIARAVEQGVNTFMETGVNEETRKQEAELLNAQLELIKAQTNRVKSAPHLGVPRAHGTARAGPSTAAALTGRDLEPVKGPMPLAGINPAGDANAAAAKVLPATRIPLAPGVTVDLPAGTPSIDTVEETLGEGASMAETARRLGIAGQQQPKYAEDIVKEITKGGLASAVGTSPTLLPLRFLQQFAPLY